VHAERITETAAARLAQARHALSRSRHDDRHPVRWFGLTFRATTLTPPAPAGWSRLVATRSGACLARAAGLLTAITPEHGIYASDGAAVELHATESVDVRILYLHAERAANPGARARAIVVTPLMRELVERTLANGALDTNEPADAHLIEVIFDEVAALEPTPFALPMPTDVRALRAAEQCLAALDAPPPPVPQLAAAAATSARTLERLFAAQTGCSLGRWQRRFRLLAAERALAAGTSVTDAAYDAGYGSPSAFIAAFRRAFGTTPGRSRSR
jgi:AraC-like DNA-binding protein